MRPVPGPHPLFMKGFHVGKQNDINLIESDFEGYSVEDVRCRGCNGPLCGDKTPKLYNGELVFVCHLGTAGQAVLARANMRGRG